MKAKFLIAGLIAASIIPMAAQAQPYDPACVQDNHDSRVAGTVAGAIGGAILGGAIAGRHNTGAGVVLGGAAGAAAGNAIAGSREHPCPSGYYYQPPPGYGPDPGPGPGDFWRGAPSGIHSRIDFMQTRINRSASNGWIGPRDADRANRELNFIRSEDQRLRYQDGGHLRPVDRDYLQGRLDNLSQRLNWDHDRRY